MQITNYNGLPLFTWRCVEFYPAIGIGLRVYRLDPGHYPPPYQATLPYPHWNLTVLFIFGQITLKFPVAAAPIERDPIRRWGLMWKIGHHKNTWCWGN